MSKYNVIINEILFLLKYYELPWTIWQSDRSPFSLEEFFCKLSQTCSSIPLINKCFSNPHVTFVFIFFLSVQPYDPNDISQSSLSILAQTFWWYLSTPIKTDILFIICQSNDTTFDQANPLHTIRRFNLKPQIYIMEYQKAPRGRS